MANGIDLEETLYSEVYDQITDAIDDDSPPLLRTLAASKECGVLLMIDKILRNQIVSSNTARLALLLLRSINHLSINVTPSTSDNPLLFVVELLSTAEAVTADPQGYSPHLNASAKRLAESLLSYKKEEGSLPFLFDRWKSFSADFYREKLYRHIGK